MRIGIIAPPWIPVPPSAYGGVEAVVDGLARGLTALGHEIVLAAGPGSTCPVRRIEATETGVAGEIGDLAGERRHVALAYDALRDVDIIHDHTLTGPGHGGRSPAIPSVTTVHGAFSPELLARYGALPADIGIIAISHNQASLANGLRVDAVIHNGIDISAVPLGDGAGGYLAFLGRMTPAKGVHEAVIAAREAGVPLRIAAKMRHPLEREYFRTEVEPLLGSDVEYLGELDTAAKYALLGSAAALLNPIQWEEPFGMAMIEAMATGTPVIATSRGSTPEIVEDGLTGFLCPTLPEFVTAIGRLDQLDRDAIRQRVDKRFSRQRMAADHLLFYEKWIARAKR